MDMDTIIGEYLNTQPSFCSNGYMLPSNDNNYSFHASSSQKTTSLQEYSHHLDQFGLTSNPLIGSQTGYLNPIDHYAYGPSKSFCFNDGNPISENNIGDCAVQVNNFQTGGYANDPNPSFKNNIDLYNGSFNPGLLQGTKPVDFVVPDEVSCMNAENGHYNKVPDKDIPIPMKSEVGKKPIIAKTHWTAAEDRILTELVGKYGEQKWIHMIPYLSRRTAKTCRERWFNHLRPNIKKDAWTEEEDRILIHAHSRIGNKWSEIAKLLPGRTENSVKNHWNATVRKQFSKRKLRSYSPRGSSLLQEYIKTKNLDALKNDYRTRYYRNVVPMSRTNTSAGTHAAGLLPPQNPEHQINNHVVPNYDFEDDPDIFFDQELSSKGYNLYTLLDELNNDPVLVDESVVMEMPLETPNIMTADANQTGYGGGDFSSYCM